MGLTYRWLLPAMTSAMLMACRIAFDELPQDAGSGEDGGDDAGSIPRTITLGDRTDSDVKNVARDTVLVEGAPAESFGGSAVLSVYAPVPSRYVALYAFDLTSLPVGTSPSAARLQLVVEDTGDTVMGTIEAFQVSEAWVEGVLDGGGSDGATWNQRAPGQPWSMPGGSRGALVGRLLDAGRVGPLTLPIDAAIVQGWIDDPTSNHGVLLAAPPGGTHVHPHAKESSYVEGRPQLEIDVL